MRRIALIISALFGHQGQRAAHQSRLAALAVVGTWVGATLLILAYLSLGLWSAHDPNLLALQATISFVISLIAAYICGALAAWQGANGGPRWWIDNGMARPGGTPLDDRVYQANRDPFPPLYNARITTQTATIVIAATIMGTTPAMIWPLHLLGLMAAMAYGFSRYASAYHGRVMRPATSIAGIFGVFAFLLEWAMFLWQVWLSPSMPKTGQTYTLANADRWVSQPAILLGIFAAALLAFVLLKNPQIFAGWGKFLKWGVAIAFIFIALPNLLHGCNNVVGAAQYASASTRSSGLPTPDPSVTKTDGSSWEIVLPANQEWLATGIKGTLSGSATGKTIAGEGNPLATPDGSSRTMREWNGMPYLLPGVSEGTLIAKDGPNGKPFVLGSAWENVRICNELYVSCNDVTGNFGDGTGSYTLLIKKR